MQNQVNADDDPAAFKASCFFAACSPSTVQERERECALGLLLSFIRSDVQKKARPEGKQPQMSLANRIELRL